MKIIDSCDNVKLSCGFHEGSKRVYVAAEIGEFVLKSRALMEWLTINTQHLFIWAQISNQEKAAE